MSYPSEVLLVATQFSQLQCSFFSSRMVYDLENPKTVVLPKTTALEAFPYLNFYSVN